MNNEMSESEYKFWKRYEEHFVSSPPISAETLKGLNALEQSLPFFLEEIKQTGWKPTKHTKRGMFGVIIEVNK